MLKPDQIRIQHMLDASKEALFFLAGKSKEDLETNRQLILSLVREIEIIGEAASKVSDETKTLFPKIPWAQIINMRNHLIHVYFDVDLDIVWDTTQKDLPLLVESLQKVLSS